MSRFLSVSSSPLERWSRPLRNAINDYVTVAKDVVKYAKDKPVRFGFTVTGGAGCILMWRRNPDMDDYMSEVIEYSNEISQCSPATRSFEAQKYLERLLLSDSQHSLQYINLGLCSIVMERPVYKYCYNYSEVCPHLQSRWSTFRQRFVDIGFWNKWWFLQQNMIDFDVNEEDSTSFT